MKFNSKGLLKHVHENVANDNALLARMTIRNNMNNDNKENFKWGSMTQYRKYFEGFRGKLVTLHDQKKINLAEQVQKAKKLQGKSLRKSIMETTFQNRE